MQKKTQNSNTKKTTDHVAHLSAHHVLKVIICDALVKEDSWHAANETYVWFWQMISGTKNGIFIY